MDCSTPGFPVLHHLLEFAQTHVHWVSDAIQPSRPLSHSSPAFSLSQGFFQWVTSLLASQLWWPKTWSFSFSFSILPRNIQDWFPLGLTGLISLLSKRLSRVFSNTTVWKHQFFGTQPFYGPTFMSIHVFFSFWPTSLYNSLWVHPPHKNWLKFVPFYGWVTFHCIYVKVNVAQLCPTLCDPMDYTVHGIL